MNFLSSKESTGEMDLQDHETPRFYKKDLLAVLREKNELKEEYDALWDELAAAKGSVLRCIIKLGGRYIKRQVKLSWSCGQIYISMLQQVLRQ